MNLTVKQYAAAMGISVQAVTKAIREERPLVGIKSVEKHGRYYLLVTGKKYKTKN